MIIHSRSSSRTILEGRPKIGQNLLPPIADELAVVGSMPQTERTDDYIEASMLTAWRIAALAWMALVALGLILICWRILRGRSARWLINWNALATAVLLAICSFVDLGAVAASWNVRRQDPAKIDLCYLGLIGDGALLPLVELEKRPMDAATRDRVRYVRDRIHLDLSARQDSWTEWTPRGARRLARADALLGPHPAMPYSADSITQRECDGSIIRPAPPVAQP